MLYKYLVPGIIVLCCAKCPYDRRYCRCKASTDRPLSWGWVVCRYEMFLVCAAKTAASALRLPRGPAGNASLLSSGALETTAYAYSLIQSRSNRRKGGFGTSKRLRCVCKVRLCCEHRKHNHQSSVRSFGSSCLSGNALRDPPAHSIFFTSKGAPLVLFWAYYCTVE